MGCSVTRQEAWPPQGHEAAACPLVLSSSRKCLPCDWSHVLSPQGEAQGSGIGETLLPERGEGHLSTGDLTGLLWAPASRGPGSGAPRSELCRQLPPNAWKQGCHKKEGTGGEKPPGLRPAALHVRLWPPGEAHRPRGDVVPWDVLGVAHQESKGPPPHPAWRPPLGGPGHEQGSTASQVPGRLALGGSTLACQPPRHRSARPSRASPCRLESGARAQSRALPMCTSISNAS